MSNNNHPQSIMCKMKDPYDAFFVTQYSLQVTYAHKDDHKEEPYGQLSETPYAYNLGCKRYGTLTRVPYGHKYLI